MRSFLPSACRRSGARTLFVSLACATLAAASASRAAQTAPLWNLGSHHRAITTTSPDAQRFFDQGLLLVFAFNHDEAIRSFQAAAAADTAAAMPWWGIAFANGPHINNPTMDPAHSQAAWDALQKARVRAGHASAVERELIEALAARYADPAPADRAPLDKAYADAMRPLWAAHPRDADIGAMTAEALMDLHPWDLWQADGSPQPWTDEITSILETALRLDPKQPLANHLYIHSVEASPHPERALASARRLRTLVPGAGHLVHMPAHIYSRVGQWKDACDANIRAIAVDAAYNERSREQGFYRVYMLHNRHFLSWASMMRGQSEASIRAAREMLASIPPDFARQMAFFADGFMCIEMEALMRFGRWDELLQAPQPPDYLPITTAFWHFSRAIALTSLARPDEARAEQQLFHDAVAKVTPEMIVGNNSAQSILAVADNMLAGEMLYRDGQIDSSVARLTEAVRLEDALRYDEAPDWIQPVRHTLGGVLFASGRTEEAEAVYRADLVHYPENGWALYGLANCLHARGAHAEAKVVDKRFAKVWAGADVTLHATCFCIRKS